MFRQSLRSWLLASVAIVSLGIGTASLVVSSSFAQDGQGQQNGQGGPGGNDAAGQGGSGEGGGSGQGGPPADAGEDEESDGRGPQYGQPGDDDERGGKPIWAQEGIPEVELGRLSVIRSPEQVLARALAEVVSNFDPATMAVYYKMTAAEFAATAATAWDTMTIIDSPLENLALLTELWTTGDVSLPEIDVPADTSMVELAAILIGVASDKNLAVSTDTVIALAVVIGATSLDDATIAEIAEKAEDVRAAVLLGHG